ncbi:hypothetical protein O1611_g961 [Lasiodiplodia mahajangana]|uniref:Uncharacterized protein n=1 Tax=Lasiodiplodia mahajangana TaxID=1108764 RepID=A0ACC2JZ03_9PEZI|nr:hypothetical protein O1611_g961 [Lasiodiplodia mahajangana]
MAVPGTIQALIAAFSFGILFNAASAALVLHVKGHGSAIYRDGLRLVLILFLLTSSSWALVEFLSTLIEPSATSTCQVAVIFSSVFDQFGRVFVEQYLVWAVPKGDAKAVFSLVPQILVFGRLFVGIAFTAVTRTQFKPTCAPVSSIRAVAITTIALDTVIVGLLAVQAFSSGSARKDTGSNSIILRIKTIRFVVVGVAVWLGTSVTSLLGLETIDLFYRTALPGIGLTILVGLVTILSQELVVPRELPRRPDSPVSREARDLPSSDSTDYPPSRYEDLKATNIVTVSAFAARTEASRGIRRNEDGTFPAISKPIAVGLDVNGNPIQEQFFLPTKPQDLTVALSMVPPLPDNRGIFRSASDRTKVKAKVKNGKLVISNPILNEDENVQSSFKKIPTMALEEAAVNDRLRREQYAQRMSTLIASRPAPRPPSPSMTPDTAAIEPKATSLLERSESTKTTKTTQTTQTSSGLSVEGNASSTGTQLSPGVDAIRRRSPRQPEPTTLATPFRVIRPGEPIRIPIPRPREQEPDPAPVKPEPVKTPLQRRPTTGLPSNPRAQTMKTLAKESGNQKTQTVMFVNNIVYDNPDAVGDIIQGANKAPQPPDSAEISPSNQHRRTKSGGSIVSRKSILQSVPGSPTGLPSLPPIPQMAPAVTRAVPNGIKSMTVEEKMDMFYSAPSTTPSGAEFNPKRRSSVPNLPVRQEVRSQPQTDDLSDSDSGNDIRASKASKRTTARTSSLLGITARSEVVSQDNGMAASFNNRNPVDELGNSWLPGIPTAKLDESLTVPEDVKRRSSPVLGRGGRLSMSTTRSEARPESQETITNWGSVYSPVVPVSRQNARSTYIKKGPRNASHSEEVPIIMLDDSGEGLGGNGPPSDSESEKSHASDSSTSQRFIKRAKAARPVEPSPVESPRAAYEVIQAQLKKFEQLDREATESPNRRLALLANLEQEMGQLESKWQSNHDHLRDSMSSIQTTPQNSRPTSTAPALSRPSSQRSSIASTIAERRASRRARMQNRDSDATLAPPTQSSSGSTRSTPRQARLAEAQAQYMENASELLVKRSNLESSSIAEASLGGPSFNTNESRELDASHDTPRPRVIQPTAPVKGLWSHRAPAHKFSKSGLWDPKISVSKELIESHELPGLSVRSATRTHLSELAIESSRLWQASVNPTSMKSPEGLWKNPASQHSEAVKASARPVTIRPPRKNKRVTLLPDIIENPEPLPDKRGTLGIFQFPWGEKSENATLSYRPSQVFTAMPGTMTTGRVIGNAMADAGAMQTEATEYSSSFFDEYDEEEGDNFSDFSSSGDDDFDETTLWEIASLLQTDQVPSKNSLLPIPWQSSPSIEASELAEYVTDMPSDDEYGNDDIIDLSTSFEHTDIEVVEKQKIPNDNVQAFLWTSQHLSREHAPTLGLPQQESLGWGDGIAEPTYRIKARPVTNSFDIMQSNKLWSSIAKETRHNKESLLWEPSKDPSELQETLYPPQQVQTQHQAPGLWDTAKNANAQRSPYGFGLSEPEVQVWQKLISKNSSFMKRSKSRAEKSLPSISSSTLWSQGKGTSSITLWVRPQYSALENTVRTPTLFRLTTKKTDYRTTSANPAALVVIRKPRTIQQPLQPLQSSRLWVNSQVTRMELNWMTMCNFRPASPMPSPSPPTASTDAASTREVSSAAGSAVTSNSVLPELPEGMVIKNLDDIPHAKGARTTPQHRQRATPRDWSVALHEAVLESYPELRYSRGQTLAYQWNTGRQDEALRDEDSEFDVATRHPVFFGSLKSAAETVHPALTGYRVSVILSYKDAHLATEEPRTQHENSSKQIPSSPRASRLWTQLSESQAAHANGLWAVTKESDLNANFTLQYAQSSDSTSYYPMRGNKASISEIDVGLTKQELWKRGSGSGHMRHPSSLQKNWLDDSVNKRFTRIELRY